MKKKLSNKNLSKAKNTKNDEFYTQLQDIERELNHYKSHFKDKVIFLNCDDPEESHFWKYFSLNFKFFGLKKLIATHYEKEKPSYKLEKINGNTITTALKQNGDFRSPECIEILKEADVILTNPPFSMFREYVTQLIEYDKKFLIIGNINAITYKNIFKLITENKIWLGYNCIRHFQTPVGTMYESARSFWYTNLDYKKRHDEFILHKEYSGNESEYPKYDNYDAIDVNPAINIPKDYDGIIGVPVTFLDKHNPEQFEILNCSAYSDKEYYGCGALYIKGKKQYARILIKQNKH